MSNKIGLLCGFGVNDADYNVTISDGRKLLWICPYYRCWSAMFTRCYRKSYIKDKPSYQGCTIDEPWYKFSTFKSWMEKQDYEGKHLDKDLLVKGNKVYGPDTCVFISQELNSFLVDPRSTTREGLVGVTKHKLTGKFAATCRSPFTGKQEHLGLYSTSNEAHQVWLTRKRDLAKQLANLEEDQRISNALIDYY